MVEVIFDTLIESYIVAVEAQSKYSLRHGATRTEPGVGSWYLGPGTEMPTFWDPALSKAKEALAHLRAAHHQRVVSPLDAEETARTGLRLLNERYVNIIRD